MNNNDLASRAVKAVVSGLVAGLVTGLLLFVVSALIPAVSINASFWATIVGVLTALYVFVTGNSRF